MLTEFELIARFFSRPPRRTDVTLSVGDDAAAVRPAPGRQVIAAVDTIVAGVHYPLDTAAADIGYRALAVNLSDLAAMGAEPAWATLSLSLAHADAAWLEEFARGFYVLAAQHGVDLIGGDTVKGPEVITVQLMGMADEQGVLKRSGAKPGDCILVSGVPGEAAAGLAILQNGTLYREVLPAKAPQALRTPQTQIAGAAAANARTSTSSAVAAALLKQRFLRPTPRVALGRTLVGKATAAMDISDGLLTDLKKLCAASGCGADLDLDALPKSHAMLELFDATRCEQFALAGGDDYELLFTAPEAVAKKIAAGETEREADGQAGEVRSTIIGRITAGQGVRCLRKGRLVQMAAEGYDHFAAQDHQV